MADDWNAFADSLTKAKAEPGSLGSILVVDDSPYIRNQVKSFLAPIGYTVLEANDGERGLNMLRENQAILMVFVDVNMPVMNGIVMVETLHKDILGGRKSLPIVMLTSDSTREKVLQAKSAGVVGWIIKPPKEEHIVAIVAKLTQQSQKAG